MRLNYRQILNACPDQAFRDLLIVAWETGARPQELTAVEARHFDTKNSRWIFPRKEAKGRRKARVVYLTARAEEITLSLMAAHPEGPLFRNSEGTAWNKNSINCRFQRLKKTLKRNVCLYDFRHAFATRKLQSGVDPITVSELMGHSDPSMLAKVYQHLGHDPQHMLNKLRSVS